MARNPEDVEPATVTRTLLTNGFLVTVDDERRVIPEGWILTEGDRIAGLGPMSELLADIAADETIDLRGQLVIPGLVNAHNHHWGSLFKNTGERLHLDSWLGQVAFRILPHLSVEDLRVAAYVSLFEQLLTGTTCSLNHVTNINDHETMKAIVEPVLELGARQLVTKELRDPRDPPMTPEHPPRPHVRSRPEELALAEEVVTRWQGSGGLITIGLVLETGSGWMVHSTTSDEIIVEGAELARRLNLRISDHSSGGSAEFQRITGGSELDYLSKLGVLGTNWVLIHALGFSERDVATVAAAGASVITNPIGNAYLAGEIAPVRALVDAGVNVGLGSDGAYVNCSLDMLEQMKVLALVQNVENRDPGFITAERAIEMATRNNAIALGLDHEIGSLEVGKKADVAVFDLRTPHIGVPNRMIGALVYSATGTDARLVMVGGHVLVRDGRLAFPPVEEVLAEARGRAAAMLDRLGMSEAQPDWHH